MKFFPKGSLPAAVIRPCLGEQPARGQQLLLPAAGAAECRQPRSSHVQCLLSLCQKYGSNGSVSGYSGSQEPPRIGVRWLCSSLHLLAPLLLKEKFVVYLIHRTDVWLIFHLASTVTPRSFLAGSLHSFLAPRASRWSVPLEALAPPEVPHLPPIPPSSDAGQAVLCVPDPSASVFCRHDGLGSAPSCAGQVVFLEAAGLRHSGPQRRKSRHLKLRETLGLVATVSHDYPSLAANVSAGSPRHQPVAWSLLSPPLTPAVL